MKMKVCGSCNKEVTDDYVDFKCPNCNKSRILRCEKCRNISTEYKCKECGFTGP
ncbi:MAG: zinc finger domain-containing protein [Candidatus Diapherotrites archaeon]